MKYIFVTAVLTFVICIITTRSSPIFGRENEIYKSGPSDGSEIKDGDAANKNGAGELNFEIYENHDLVGYDKRYLLGRYNQLLGEFNGTHINATAFVQKNYGSIDKSLSHGISLKLVIPLKGVD